MFSTEVSERFCGIFAFTASALIALCWRENPPSTLKRERAHSDRFLDDIDTLEKQKTLQFEEKMRDKTIEICVSDIESAIASWKGGCTSLEVS